MDFKNTMMYTITKNAIFNWGESDAQRKWFRPTPEQAEQILSEGGLKLADGKVIEYSSSEQASNEKTYASEVAAIKGILSVLQEAEGKLELEEKDALIEEIKTQIYTQDKLNPEIADRIRNSMEKLGTEKATMHILGAIHDNWVKSNGNKFDDPNRANRLHQFVDLRLMTFDGDGALADLIFVEPILNGAGVTLDMDKLEKEFEAQQRAYKDEMGINGSDGLRKHIENLAENYPAISGVTTNKGKTLPTPILISEAIKDPSVLERMTQQVAGKCNVEYTEPKTLSDKAQELNRLNAEREALEELANGLSQGIDPAQDPAQAPEIAD